MARTYRQLDLDQRRTLFRLVEARRPVGEIAVRLGRHPSTIYREPGRNRFRDGDRGFRGYFLLAAQDPWPRRTWPTGAGVVAASWSPTTPCARTSSSGSRPAGRRSRSPAASSVRRRTDDPSATRPSTGTSMGRRAARAASTVTCRKLADGAGPATAASPGGRKPRTASIPRERWIENRPAEVGTRETFGHREADLLIFAKGHGKANVTSLLERRSRFTLLLPNDDRRSSAVLAGIAGALRGLPGPARRTVTFDRGTEFAAYAALDRHLALASYFCDPHSPWQKGSVENANGRIRRFLPREAEPEALGRAHLRRLADRLNDTPRRCLGYRTPREVFEEYLAAPDGSP